MKEEEFEGEGIEQKKTPKKENDAEAILRAKVVKAASAILERFPHYTPCPVDKLEERYKRDRDRLFAIETAVTYLRGLRSDDRVSTGLGAIVSEMKRDSLENNALGDFEVLIAAVIAGKTIEYREATPERHFPDDTDGFYSGGRERPIPAMPAMFMVYVRLPQPHGFKSARDTLEQFSAYKPSEDGWSDHEYDPDWREHYKVHTPDGVEMWVDYNSGTKLHFVRKDGDFIYEDRYTIQRDKDGLNPVIIFKD